jgi:Ser/Thr protein kinase RdoA (MazF antagonist)
MTTFRCTAELGVWTHAIDAAGARLTDTAALSRLAAADRELLRDIYVELRAGIERSTIRPRPIHGDARAGNLLRSPTGYLWMDFEAVCLGPAEWDLASLPAGTEARLPDVDAALLVLLRGMRQLCLVVWCWNQYERTAEIASAAELHFHLLKKSLRMPRAMH